MPDETLHGNHDRCTACELRRQEAGLSLGDKINCQLCDGRGIIPLSAEEIVRRQVAWNREHYWPEWEKRLAPDA